MADYSGGTYIGALLIRPAAYLPSHALPAMIDHDLHLKDMADGGTLSVSGTVLIEGTPQTPVARRVRLHDHRTGRLVRETWSDPLTGAYAFTGIRAGTFYVVSHDHTLNFNAVIRDRVESA